MAGQRQSHGFSVMAHMDEAAMKELQSLQRRWPKEYKRALAAIGYYMRQKMQLAMGNGGKGLGWEPLSYTQRSQRLEAGAGRSAKDANDLAFKSLGKTKESRQKSLAKLRENAQGSTLEFFRQRWKKWGSKKNSHFPRNANPMARLRGGIRYKLVHGGKGVIIGGITPNMEKYLVAVQDGTVVGSEEGGLGYQRVTQAMRILFWKSGLPISKKTTMLRRPKRPLIEPIFEKRKQAMFDFIQERVRILLLGPYEERDVTALRVGLRKRGDYY